VQAKWNASAGTISLTIGKGLSAQTVTTSAGGPISIGPVSPVFRIGTDRQNQYPLNGYLDNFQISKL
jgi:hypothetical protein